LQAALRRVQSVFDWPERSDQFEIAESWQRSSSGAWFYRVAASHGRELLVKCGDRWTGEDAGAVHESMEDLRRLLAQSGIEQTGTIPSLGWSDDPPMVVMPFVEADELISVLRSGELGRLEPLMEKAGRLLGAFHQAHPVEEADRSRAHAQVTDLAGRLPGGARLVSPLLEEAGDRVALSFGDITPGNILLADDGRMLLIDPPITPSPAVIHRDLGYFLVESHKHFAGRGRSPSMRHRGFEALKDPFLRGYANETGPLGPPDKALIALFEARQASGNARNRWPRRAGDALWFAAQAVGAGSRFMGVTARREYR
jgi:Phosphotransferase enzyme family